MIKKKHRLLHRRKRLKSQRIYKQEDINNVMHKLHFTEVISDFVSLKKAGCDQAGRCPFCKTITKNDKHFRVSQIKSRYKCFECGAAGANAISFLMRYYELPFDEIIQFVDRKYTKTGIKPEIIRPMKKGAYRDEDLPF